MTTYIAGIDIIENNNSLSLIRIKRHSNQKWYSAKELLEAVKYAHEVSEGKVKSQFFREFTEIKKVCVVFSVSIPTELVCKENKDKKKFDNDF